MDGQSFPTDQTVPATSVAPVVRAGNSYSDVRRSHTGWDSPVSRGDTALGLLGGVDTNERLMDDGRFTGAAARPSQPDEQAPTPQWLTGDDPLGRSHGRQVLVVGDRLAGLALTTFLTSGGLDPVLVGSGSTEPTTRLLWPPTLGLLADVGLADEVAAVAEPATGISVVDATDAADSATRSIEPDATPVVVRGDYLCDRFRERLPDHAVERDRTVDTVRERDGAAVVEFDDGVREWFDAVVAADAGSVDRPRGGSATVSSVLQREVVVDGDGLPERHLRDVWHRHALVQRFPSPRGTGPRLRVTTTEPVPDAWSTDGDWTGVPGVDPDRGRSTEWRTVPQFLDAAAIGPGWWGGGHVPRCGPAALPVAPASGLRTALAIEDAWTLASVLVDGPCSVTETIDAYASRRSRRLSAVLDATEPPRDGGCSKAAALRAVVRLRTAALGSVASEGTDAARDGDR